MPDLGCEIPDATFNFKHYGEALKMAGTEVPGCWNKL